MKRLAILFLVGTGFAACGQQPADDGDAPAETASLTSMSVHVNSDGTTSTFVTHLTPTQMRAEVLAKQRYIQQYVNGVSLSTVKTPSANGLSETRSAITLDSGCAATSMWIYDTTDTSGNRICFDGAGTLSLVNYCHDGTIDCAHEWGAVAKSFWPGNESGQYVPFSGFGCPATQSFAVWGPFTQFSCVGQENTLTLN